MQDAIGLGDIQISNDIVRLFEHIVHPNCKGTEGLVERHSSALLDAAPRRALSATCHLPHNLKKNLSFIPIDDILFESCTELCIGIYMDTHVIYDICPYVTHMHICLARMATYLRIYLLIRSECWWSCTLRGRS